MNTVGNIFSGQVVGETAKMLSERFGKVLQKRQSMTLSRNDKSTSISTQMDSLIPASKISTLTQGMFVGAVADSFEQPIEQKIFHAEIVVDSAKVKAETARYEKIPIITDFTDENGTRIACRKRSKRTTTASRPKPRRSSIRNSTASAKTPCCASCSRRSKEHKETELCQNADF